MPTRQIIPTSLVLYYPSKEYADGVAEGIRQALRVTSVTHDVIMRTMPYVEEDTSKKSGASGKSMFQVRTRFAVGAKADIGENRYGRWIEITSSFFEEEYLDF